MPIRIFPTPKETFDQSRTGQLAFDCVSRYLMECYAGEPTPTAYEALQRMTLADAIFYKSQYHFQFEKGHLERLYKFLFTLGHHLRTYNDTKGYLSQTFHAILSKCVRLQIYTQTHLGYTNAHLIIIHPWRTVVQDKKIALYYDKTGTIDLDCFCTMIIKHVLPNLQTYAVTHATYTLDIMSFPKPQAF